MQRFLSRNGLFVLLIPIFFVLHGYAQNVGMMTVSDCLYLLATYLVASIILYGIAWFIFRNHLKAALLSAFLLSCYLFFGSLLDFLKAYLNFLSHYSVIVPLGLVCICVLVFYLKRTRSQLYKVSFFINILLLIYLVVDLGGIIWKSTHQPADKLSIYDSNLSDQFLPCDTCKNPDIYFLLFDEYSSTAALKETFHYDNSGLDSFLLDRGFSLQSQSRSNYNFTPFSMASMLNLNYIAGLKNPGACTLQDYANCNALIRNNEVIRFLSSRLYEIVNYSVFDLAGNPSLVESSLLPVKTRLITAQTFFNRINHDIGWNLKMGKYEWSWLTKDIIYGGLHNNNQFLDLLSKETRQKTGRPKFVYAHFQMPHGPFFYDRNMQLRDRKKLMAEQQGHHIDSYLDYIPYTNQKIKELIDTIQQNTNHSAVIILMGDHGFRVTPDGSSTGHYFQNLNAVYFPEKNYRELNDSISGVNQFRIIFNTLFRQSLPVLKDSTVFLTDQPEK